MHELSPSDQIRVAEGPDLDVVLAKIHAEHGTEAHILTQEIIRTGGLLGFFARRTHRVGYVPTEPAPTETPSTPMETETMQEHDAGTESITAASDALLELLGSADLVEQSINQPSAPADTDFAKVLEALTTQEVDRTPVTQLHSSSTRHRLEVLMQLRTIGVPVLLDPRAASANIYQSVSDIIDELPTPPAPPRRAGDVLVLVGDLTPSLQAAHAVATSLRLSPDTIRVAGQPAFLRGGYPEISGPGEAARVGAELHASANPSIVVVATDGGNGEPTDLWPQEMLHALHPTAVWAVVDATRKTDDARAQLAGLDTVDALAVHSAQLSTSPATVWDLDLPIALVDGRTANTAVWSGLMLGLLRAGSDKRATA